MTKVILTLLLCQACALREAIPPTPQRGAEVELPGRNKLVLASIPVSGPRKAYLTCTAGFRPLEV